MAETFQTAEFYSILPITPLSYFFKASIFTKQSSAWKNTHNLLDLHNRYQKMFQDSDFGFCMPFGLDDSSPIRWSDEEAANYFNNLDQMYRYTLDIDLKPSPVIEGFLPEQFYMQLQSHRSDFDRLIPLIIGNSPPARIGRTPS